MVNGQNGQDGQLEGKVAHDRGRYLSEVRDEVLLHRCDESQ